MHAIVAVKILKITWNIKKYIGGERLTFQVITWIFLSCTSVKTAFEKKFKKISSEAFSENNINTVS